MENFTSIYRIPLEVLTKTFSYLDSNEVMIAGKVCLWFNEVSKHPSLWKSLKVNLEEPRKLLSFCQFFTEVPYLQNLTLVLNQNEFRLKWEIDLLNLLFSKLVFLKCLNIECQDLTHIVLPLNLRHLHCRLYPNISALITDCTSDFVTMQLKSIEKCSMVKILNLDFEGLLETKPDLIMSDSDSNIITKFESSLESLRLKPFDVGWIPFIKNCKNIKEVYLPRRRHVEAELKYNDLLEIVMLPRLEAFVVNEKVFSAFFHVLKDYTLPELKSLHIVDCFACITEIFSDRILKNIPKLERLCIAGECSVMDFTDLFEFIENCKTLKHFCCDYVCSAKTFYVFVEKLSHLSELRSFDSICLCPTLNWMRNCHMDIPLEILRKISVFPCQQFHYGEIKESECLCSFPGHYDVLDFDN